jgi:riboflavin synthase
VGESIAVDGCCLTLAADPSTQDGRFAFDVVPETRAKTTIGGLVPGARVHLEPSATLATLLGGHLVQGHIDGVGRVLGVQASGEWRVRIGLTRDLMAYLAPKGSVCVQGVSLTIAAVSPAEGWFEVALVPTTLEKTTLGGLRAGDGVNVECDAIAKTVVNYLRHFRGE